MGVSLAKITCESDGHMGCARCTIGGRPVSLAKVNPVVRAKRLVLSGPVVAYMDVRQHRDGTVTVVPWRRPDRYRWAPRTENARVASGTYPNTIANNVWTEESWGHLVGVKTLR